MRFIEILGSFSLSFLGSGLVLASPGAFDLHYNKRRYDIPKTCTATYITTIAVKTVPVTVTTFSLATVTTVATLPHSCYTYLEATPQSNNEYCGTVNITTCGPHPDCILLETVTVPCHDPCCPTTATVKTPGACVSCQRGCGTATTVVTASNCNAETTGSRYY